MDNDFIKILKNHGLRVTTPRLDIFTAFSSHDAPMTIIDLIRECPDVDKVSIYRTVRLFSELGIITMVVHTQKDSYELAAPFRPHHHHMICERCNLLIVINSEQVERLIGTLAGTYNFLPSFHHFEVRGICSSCIESGDCS